MNAQPQPNSRILTNEIIRSGGIQFPPRSAGTVEQIRIINTERGSRRVVEVKMDESGRYITAPLHAVTVI